MSRDLIIKLMVYTYGNLHRGGWSEASEEQRFDEVLKVLEDRGMKFPEDHKCLSCDNSAADWDGE